MSPDLTWVAFKNVSSSNGTSWKSYLSGFSPAKFKLGVPRICYKKNMLQKEYVTKRICYKKKMLQKEEHSATNEYMLQFFNFKQGV